MRPRILVVDDDAENCRALSELLSAEGFDPLPFESGEAAWAAMASGAVQADIVVADVRMPGLDGVALVQLIKVRYPTIPVVLVSAFAEEGVWSAGLRAGAVDVFPKPIHGASLVRALKDAVGMGQARGPLPAEDPDPQPTGINRERRDK